MGQTDFALQLQFAISFYFLTHFSTHDSICIGCVEKCKIKQIEKKGKMKGVRKKRNRAAGQHDISMLC